MNALIVVDIQNDFIPGGALAVPRGDEVIPVAHRLMKRFGLVIATQDWHPPGHGSFASTHGREAGEIIELGGLPQVLWPDHCVRGTWGAQFAPGLDLAKIQKVIHKGTDPEIDSYSTFFDNAHRKATGLEEYLRSLGVDEIFIAGLATDYCVRFSSLDALQCGFKVNVLIDGCRGVELNPGDVEKAVVEMRSAGAKIRTSEELINL